MFEAPIVLGQDALKYEDFDVVRLAHEKCTSYMVDV
jgi:hypothetical protein